MFDIQDHFTYKLKKIMHQNIAAGISSLNHVKIKSDHDKPKLTYDK